MQILTKTLPTAHACGAVALDEHAVMHRDCTYAGNVFCRHATRLHRKSVFRAVAHNSQTQTKRAKGAVALRNYIWGLRAHNLIDFKQNRPALQMYAVLCRSEL